MTNPLLLAIRMPGETFRLPSGGLFYPADSGILAPNVVDGEIMIMPMTALDEIAFKTPELLFSGQAVDQVFARCVPDVLLPRKLLARDVDFILIALRKVSYGMEMEISYTHDCETTVPSTKEGETPKVIKGKSHSYIVPVDSFLKKSRRIDPSRVTSDFTLELKNKQIVKLAPLSYGNFVELMQTNEKENQTTQELADGLYASVSKIILSVDNVTDPAQILEWLSKIPPILLKQITEAIDRTTEWGPDFMSTLKCKDCGQEVSVQTPLNPLSFFT